MTIVLMAYDYCTHDMTIVLMTYDYCTN